MKTEKGARWCQECDQYHDFLYLCDHYSEELKQEVRAANDRYSGNLSDPEWIQKQIDNGVPLEVLEIFGALNNNTN